MSNSSQPESSIAQAAPRQRQRRRGGPLETESGGNSNLNADVDVGRHLRKLRNERGLSIRSLAEYSGLNVNTLSLIENGKTSPSVSTLQQLAAALGVPITAFFEVEVLKRNVSYLKAGQRPRAAFAHGTFEDLGVGLTLQGGQPLILNLEPYADSGDKPIVHTGHEFVYCLEGRLLYTIDEQEYLLDPHDSLLFEARLPHHWQNAGGVSSRSLLILCPADESDHPTERHFLPD